jgi:hypothetical protein
LQDKSDNNSDLNEEKEDSIAVFSQKQAGVATVFNITE